MGLISTYRTNRCSFIDLGRELTESEGDALVPATPEWTVRQVFAHMAGVADDVLAGRLEGVATDPWTAAQVAARADRSLPELVEEWDRLGPQLEEALKPIEDQIDPRLLIDLWTHEQDVRGAVQRPGGDLGPTLDWIVSIIGEGWAKRIDHKELPKIRLLAGEHTFGSPDAAASLRIDPYEAARMAVGRRSVAQIAGYEWIGVPDPTIYITTLVAFTPAAADIVDARL